MCFPYPLHCSVNGEQPVQEPALPQGSLAGLRSKTCLGRPGGLITSCRPPKPLNDAQAKGVTGREPLVGGRPHEGA